MQAKRGVALVGGGTTPRATTIPISGSRHGDLIDHTAHCRDRAGQTFTDPISVVTGEIGAGNGGRPAFYRGFTG